MGSASRVEIALGSVTNTCFVVMPFDRLFASLYERVIRPAAEELGLHCERGDEIYARPNVVADIWKAIREARVVVAELSGKNPNVLYEIGLAHALGKPIIMLTRNEDDVPFDLKALRYRFYDTNDPFWGENLRRSLVDMLHAALDESSLSVYLEGIRADVKLDPVSRPVASTIREHVPDLSGVWEGAWTSAPFRAIERIG